MNESSSARKLNLNLDYRWISLALLATILIILFVWKPWSSAQTSDRTIDVTGEATVSARADQFVFSPNYQFENADKDAALEQLTAKSDELVSQLKDLGVADSDIKTNSDSWSFPVRGEDEETTTYTLRLAVTVKSKELAQKVQDYLVTTTPTGSVSPQATFSEEKLKEVEAEARDAATADARKKAEQSAENLGFKLGAVKSVGDDTGFGGVRPLDDKAITMEAQDSSLTVQPGENKLNYSVTVTYYIK